MAKLSLTVQRFIVQALAAFDTPSQVVRDVKETFGIELTRQRVAAYDPTTKSGRELGPELTKHFHESREAFKASAAQIPLASQAFRLRVLQRHFTLAEGRQNTAMVLRVLEQASKEVVSLRLSAETIDRIAGPDLELAERGRALLAAAMTGEVSAAQANHFMATLGALAKLIETDELARRVAALEGQRGPTE